MPALEEVSKGAHKAARNPALKDLREAVRAALQERRQYAGGVKLTLEITPEMNTRAKRYLLDKSSGGTVRAMLTELLSEFLTGEGY